MLETSEEIAPFTVAGFAARVGNADLDAINAAWQAFFASDLRDTLTGRLNDDIFALYTDYETDHTGPFTLVIGYQLADASTVPAGVATVVVPGGRYAVLATEGEQPAATVAAWQQIWTSALPRAYTVDFDRHDWASAGARVTVNVALSGDLDP